MVNKLLSLRADPNKRSRGGCTPLHSACEFGQISVVKILLEAGAKSNAEDNQFETPLDRATFAYNVQYSLSEETVRELEGLLLGVSF